MSDPHAPYDPDDPWALTPGAGKLAADGHGSETADYEVHTLDGIVPLHSQLGVLDPDNVPDTLFPIVFGADDAPLTYAILDAAKIDGLPERLETSDLPHGCLFDNAEDFGSAAPWLVEITPDAPLTRHLFTQGDGPRALWHTDTGVFLRSDLPLAELRAHLRLFTQVKTDTKDAPVFFRFWEPRVMARFLHHHDPSARDHLRALIGDGMMIAVDAHNDRAVYATAQAPHTRVAPVWPLLHEDLAPIRLQIFCEDLADRIAEDIPPLADVDRAERRETVTALVHAARAIGLRMDKSVTRYTIATLMTGQQPETDPRFADIIDSPRHELDRSRQILNLARAL